MGEDQGNVELNARILPLARVRWPKGSEGAATANPSNLPLRIFPPLLPCDVAEYQPAPLSRFAPPHEWRRIQTSSVASQGSSPSRGGGAPKGRRGPPSANASNLLLRIFPQFVP